jgi:two-component system sensor histidine kinase BarA
VLAGRKVLVADSHAVSRRAIKNTLLYFGMQVYLQPQRQRLEAVLEEAMAAGSGFDVLVLGGKAGEFTPERMVELEKTAQVFDVRVLVLISDEDQVRELQRTVKEKRCIVVSTKPIRRQRLLENLQRVIECQKRKKASKQGIQLQYKAAAKVLIADDNAFSRQLLQACLRRLGIGADLVEDGFALVERARVRKYDMIFLDIHMPAMDGISAARLIREETINNLTPLVAVTADLFLSAQKSDQEELFNEILFKPVSADAVAEIVARILPGDAKSDLDQGAEADDLQQPERFRAALDVLVEQLVDASSARLNREDLKSVAHQINGLTGYFGVEALSRKCRLLEETALSADAEEIRVMVAEIRSAVSALAQ